MIKGLSAARELGGGGVITLLEKLKADQVRLFLVNWENEYGDDTGGIVQGNLNCKRQPINGVLLQQSHVDKLFQARMDETPANIILSFWAHHTFVFFSDSKPIGCLDVSFESGRCRETPFYKQTGSWDLRAIAELIETLGLPVSNPEWKIDKSPVKRSASWWRWAKKLTRVFDR